jgi:hypothetical protein
MLMSSPASLAIGLLWAFVIVSAVISAADAPLPIPAGFSPAMTVTLLLMPVLLAGAMPFWAKHSPFYHPTLARFVDSRFGEGALASFLVRLRPLLLFAVAAILQGTLGLIYALRSDSPSATYVGWGFFLSAGISFALAHGLLYLRKAIGVYPLEGNFAQCTQAISRPERKSLRDALRLYWGALVGIGLFPTVAFVGGEFLHIPFEYLVLPFFAVCMLAGWPHLSGRAPYSFWLVAVLVYLAGGLFAALLTQAIRIVLS